MNCCSDKQGLGPGDLGAWHAELRSSPHGGGRRGLGVREWQLSHALNGDQA
jgi:hypothetical protein